MKTAVAPLPADPEPAPLNDMWIEKGTPAFMKTVLALFSGGFATFALLYCVQPMMPLLSHEFSINAAQSSLVLSVSTGLLADYRCTYGYVQEGEDGSISLDAASAALLQLDVGQAFTMAGRA